MRENTRRSVFIGILFTMVVLYVYWPRISNQQKTTSQMSCNLDNFRQIPQDVDQTDPCLVDFVKKKMLVSPRPPESMKTIPFSRLHVDVECNIEKLKWVQMLIMDGAPKDTQFFFLECGAHDGKWLSTTVRLETLFGWNGVLIEQHADRFKRLLENRKVWAVNAAVCTTPNPGFFGNSPCLPLYTVLAALNVNVVDYLSLDVDSADLLVLKTVPFDKVTFKLIMVEYPHIPGDDKVGQFVDLLEPKGYHMIHNITIRYSADLVFVHDSVYQQKKSIIDYLKTI